MAAEVFVIQEFRRVGADTRDVGGGERFEWTAAKHSIPKRPWTFGGALNTVRTDYSGAQRPSQQVLSAKFKPFTLEGVWDDKYNEHGFAVAEMRRFEEMCLRGNPVRIEFQGQAFEGLIDDWDFPYEREWEIGYRFTVSNHGRQDVALSTDRAVTAPRPAAVIYDTTLIVAQAMASRQREERTVLFADSTGVDIDDLLNDLEKKINDVGDTLDSRSDVMKPLQDFKRIATQMRVIQGSAAGIITRLTAVRSDVELAMRTALSVLDFESFTRNMRFQARVLMGHAQQGAKELDQRQEPKATRFYRPHQGESLYSVSRRFYGTPYAWRLIYDRNNLHTMTLTGTEELIIPERGEG
jgi:hypothetical protein